MLKNITYEKDLPVKIEIASVSNYPIHMHPDIQLIYVLEGHVDLNLTFKTYRLKKNDFRYIHSEDIHSLSSEDNSNIVLILSVDIEYLEKIFTEALAHPGIAALSIGTRPDCLGKDVIALLSRLNRQKPVWVELGLQTIHEKTAAYIRRGYPLSCFEDAVRRLRSEDIEVIVHTILGLPGESTQDILNTMKYLNHQDIQGIKLQLLHVLQGTDLASDYEKGLFRTYERDEYISLVISCLEHLRPDMVIHRITGDGPKDLLIAPLWASRKQEVLNLLHHQMKENHNYQGRQTNWQIN